MKENLCGSGPRRSDQGVPARAVPGALLAIFLLCLALFPAGAAGKSWKVVETFGGLKKAGEATEEEQLNGVSAFAVNYSGAGGVPKGTVYAATHANGANRVVRFTPEGDGLKFVERWEIAAPRVEKIREENTEAPYKICGPVVEPPAEPPAPGSPGEDLPGEAHCAEAPEGSQGGLGIAVDQTTGYVYVGVEGEILPAGEPLIHAYTPNGSSVVAHFGEQGPVGQAKPEAETPGQIHSSSHPGWLTVNGAGEVYAFDLEPSNNFYHRLMVFRPNVPGDYTKYKYAGTSADIGAGFLNKTNFLEAPVLDQAGNVYVKSGQAVEEYNPATPETAICKFSFPNDGISALTVNPATGEPFFFVYRKESRGLYELSACEDGHFHKTGEVQIEPERSEVYSLGFDPNRQFAGRADGAVYAGAAGGSPIEGKGEGGTSGLGYILAQPEENSPKILSESIDQVSTDSARLQGSLDPHGPVTRYTFEYVTEAAYLLSGGFAEASRVGGTAEGSGARKVVATATSLAPDTAYVFRLSAVSHCSISDETKECFGEGGPHTFHTYRSERTGLPDGRAYELVSPKGKQGGQVWPANPGQKSCVIACKPGEAGERFPVQSSRDGNAVVYEGGPFGAEGALLENEYLSRRESSGWSTSDLAPNQLENRNGNGYKAFSPALTVGILGQGQTTLSGSALADYGNLYSQRTGDSVALSPFLSPSLASPTCPSGNEKGSLELTYAGASADLSRAFFEANDALVPGADGGCEESNLYEWSAGVLRSVNILPGGVQSAPNATFGSGALLRSGNPNAPSAVVGHAVSADGTRAFFTGADGRLYARLEGARTLEIPTPGNCQKTTPLTERVCFLTASADGNRVLLSNGQLLTLNDSQSSYEDAEDLTGGSGGFLGIAGQSEDLSQIYFVDTAVLTGAETNEYGAAAAVGQNNLYAWSDGQTRFVAVLAAEDGSLAAGDWTATPVLRTAEASPDGRWLVFQSVAELTGYENVGPCARNTVGMHIQGACTEAFVYDSQTGSLSCASCNPSGGLPVGPTSLTIAYNAHGSLQQPRYLNNAGRLLFDSGDSLVLGDTNGGVEDVYEFEPSGVGGCTGKDSCLSLVSSGRGSADSNFLAMDESGDNVFFTTRDQLVKADTDQLIDLYDARVGGGFPEPVIPAECEGEACQAPTSMPAQPTPSSMSIAGEPGPRKRGAAKCKKGRVKRKGRCVKSEKHKKARQGVKRKPHGKGTKSRRQRGAGRKGGNR